MADAILGPDGRPLVPNELAAIVCGSRHWTEQRMARKRHLVPWSKRKQKHD